MANVPHPNGYGLVKMPEFERTAYGTTISGDTVIAVVNKRLSMPLASQALLAAQLGIGRATVEVALNTPFAKRQLAGAQQDMPTLAKRLHEAQGDAVEYWGKSLVKGMQELEKDEPQAPILVNARECGNSVSKATQLHRDGVRITVGMTDSEDYLDLTPLEADPELVALAQSIATPNLCPTNQLPQGASGSVEVEGSAEQEQEPGGGITHPGQGT